MSRNDSQLGGAGSLAGRLAAVFYFSTVVGFAGCWIFAIALSVWSKYLAAFVLAYVAYIWGPGRKLAESEGSFAPLRRLGIWKVLARYFKAEVEKTCDLDPSKTYLFAFHPHGIICHASFLNFGTDATNFSEVFPGLRPHLLTLDTHLRTPFAFHYALFHRIRSCSRKACVNILSGKAGNVLVLSPGGAKESLMAAPGTCDLLLARRKGFVRVALLSGAALVPVINFGENDVFDTTIKPRDSLVARIQRALPGIIGLAPPIFSGTGFSGKGGGLCAYPVKLTSVVGAPIELPKLDPQAEGFAAAVDKYHAEYTSALTKLWDAHKDRLAPDRKSELRIVE